MTNEINKMKQKLNENLEIDEINESYTMNDLKSEISDISETHIELLEQVNNPKELEINTGDVNQPSTSRVKTSENSPRSSHIRIAPTYYTDNYEWSDRTNAIWNSILNKKWTPKQVTEQYNFLDLDCVIDINKAILLWVGNISIQLIDNEITTKETPGYIERTFVGTTKLWIGNLPPDCLETLRSDKKIDGSPSTTNIDILDKYESTIRSEFGSMTTDIREQNREKIINRQLMTKLAICKMCYVEEFTCAFKEY